MDSKFSHNIWCVQDSNGKKPDGSYIYVWTFDGNVKQLKGKKVGINVRKRIYEYNGQVRETTEIGQFETVDDVRNGKCKPMKDRDTRKNSSDEPQFTEVSTSEVSVPW